MVRRHYINFRAERFLKAIGCRIIIQECGELPSLSKMNRVLGERFYFFMKIKSLNYNHYPTTSVNCFSDFSSNSRLISRVISTMRLR